MYLKVRPLFRVLAGLIMLQGLFVLVSFWYYRIADVPEIVVAITAVMTIACAYVAFFAKSPERETERSQHEEPNFNQDITPMLAERSWQTVFAYIGFVTICLLFLYAWDRIGFLYG